MIVDYNSLRTEIASWLNRRDLEESIGTFIQLAEREFIRDRRARKLAIDEAFEIAMDGEPLPVDLQSLEAWQHDGPVYFGSLTVVDFGSLGSLKTRLGRTTGPPSYVALVDGASYFAPEPDDTYTTKMTYWRKIVPLSDGIPTNWILRDNPDLYLYGSLMQASPFLKDDNRVVLWKSLKDEAMESLHLSTWNEQFSGNMVPVYRPIG